MWPTRGGFAGILRAPRETSRGHGSFPANTRARERQLSRERVGPLPSPESSRTRERAASQCEAALSGVYSAYLASSVLTRSRPTVSGVKKVVTKEISAKTSE